MDFADIIIVSIAIISMVISAISKNAKKRAELLRKPENAEYETEEYADNGGDIFEEPVYDGLETITAEVTKPIRPEPEERELWSYDTQVVNAINRQEPRLKAKKYNKSPQEIDENTYAEKENKQTSGNTPKDFNLRDAIIYSELLKPKFKEY